MGRCHLAHGLLTNGGNAILGQRNFAIQNKMTKYTPLIKMFRKAGPQLLWWIRPSG
jgi:hypothetical protein